MFEAEIKYVVAPAFAPPGRFLGETTYHDAYFDTPDRALAALQQELRLRETGGRAVLTYKAAPFDQPSRSKEEWETAVADPAAMAAILSGLGFVRTMAFAKHCRCHEDTFRGLPFTLTRVVVDFADSVFLEIEHQAASRHEALSALAAIRHYAAGLGLTEECPTSYTDLYLARQPRP